MNIWSKLHCGSSTQTDDVTTMCICVYAGEYGAHIKFNDEHVPESPTMVRVLPLSRDAKKVQIVGLRDRGLDVCISVSSAA